MGFSVILKIESLFEWNFAGVVLQSSREMTQKKDDLLNSL